jgi:membrane protein implicated in regulation of membrane protease activity
MSPTFWHWFALAGILLLLEVATPGVVFLWLAVAAGVAGALLWLAPGLPWQAQVLAFAGAAVVTVGLSFWWRRRLPATGGDSGLNRRAHAYVGTEAELVGAIGAGHGRVRIADSTWAAAGPELPAGTRVRIVGARGAVLLVAPVAGTGDGAPPPAPLPDSPASA